MRFPKKISIFKKEKMVKILSIFSCILATWAVVVSGRGHFHTTAPIQSPVEGPSPIGAPTVDCMSLIYDMADCIAYLSVDGGEDKPDKSCCSGFKTILDTDSDCICVALKNSASLGIEVNMTSARALPSACGIKAPPLNCISAFLSESLCLYIRYISHFDHNINNRQYEAE